MQVDSFQYPEFILSNEVRFFYFVKTDHACISAHQKYEEYRGKLPGYPQKVSIKNTSCDKLTSPFSGEDFPTEEQLSVTFAGWALPLA
jgi:hypothetical protein